MASTTKMNMLRVIINIIRRKAFFLICSINP
jgi:hypothetical protein